jgi:hypothetical protein
MAAGYYGVCTHHQTHTDWARLVPNGMRKSSDQTTNENGPLACGLDLKQTCLGAFSVVKTRQDVELHKLIYATSWNTHSA